MKRRLRKPGARYYGMQTTPPPRNQTRHNHQRASSGEVFWLILIAISFLLTVLLPFWPNAHWPKMAIYTGGTALLGIVSIFGFFITYIKTHSS